MPRLSHFEIHAGDPERAMRFYGEVLGWRFEPWPGPMDYWLVRTGSESETVDGGLLRRRGSAPVSGQPVNAYVCTFDVPDLDSYLQSARRLGAVPAVDKMPVPGVGWLAYLQDPEGNLFGMLQRDSSVGA
jgi:uncharacterized protein